MTGPMLAGLTAVVAAAVAWLLTSQVAAVTPRESGWLRSRAHVPLAAAGGAGAALLADGWAELVGFAAAAVGCALLSVIDLAVRRLPDRVVGATLLGLVLPLVLEAGISGAWADLGRAGLGALALVAGYFVLAFIAPSGLGLGDVKFAAVIGAFLGWFGWWQVGAGTLLAFLINALVATVVLVSRRGSRRSQIPFGPAMMAGAVAAVLLAG
ncbi:prepilin peptidase [Pseudactinotalea sp. Z1732]|uniref:prepilin peptidase n=1 Tax=Micrococcales TaxID=85006 RepID=UPI003C7D13E4